MLFMRRNALVEGNEGSGRPPVAGRVACCNGGLLVVVGYCGDVGLGLYKVQITLFKYALNTNFALWPSIGIQMH